MPPPANTPGSSTPEQASGEAALLLPRSTTPMSYLSAPVPNFAAGLYTHSGDAADEANTSFLRQSLDLLSTATQAPRASVDQTRDPRLGLSRRERTSRPNRSTSPIQRDHLQRYLTHLYRMHNPPAGGGAAGTTAYSNRTPSPHRQSLYDWAPASTTRPRQRESTWTRPAATVDQDNRRRHQRTTGEDQPLPSATERMLRYFMDRERSGLSEEEERARGAGWYRPNPTRPTDDDWAQRWPTIADEPRPHRSREDIIDAFRREYLSENVPQRTSASPRPAVSEDSALVETAVKYLDQLRECSGIHDAFQAAIELDLISKPLFADGHLGFLFDLKDLAPFHWSSWLQPGSIFEGHQYASTAILRRPDRSAGTRVNDHPPGSTQFTGYREMNLLRTHSSAVPLRALLSGGDHWPVRMIIHTVNLEDMTLQGTMEAYDVPQHTISTDPQATTLPKAGKKAAPITTYVEGHIIDCFHHSFLTPKPRVSKYKLNVQRDSDSIFPAAKPARDADNWKKLPPFNELSERAVTETLLSKERMNAINEQYVFMRWKERCFVHGKNDTCSDTEKHNDTDKGHGLTISGFYYISMRRSDGAIEGLYYDPNSTPYQHLKLKGMSPAWPTWQFR